MPVLPALCSYASCFCYGGEVGDGREEKRGKGRGGGREEVVKCLLCHRRSGLQASQSVWQFYSRLAAVVMSVSVVDL